MSTGNENRHRKRVWLWHRQRGACYWCHRSIVIINKYLKYPPDNLATFEHLDSRLSPERGRHPGERRVVLACLRCNNERAHAEERALPLAELQRRASGGVRQ